MIAMSKEKGQKFYYRTTAKLRGVYAKLLGNLRATDAISSRPGYTSNDSIVNALLLWASERDPDELAPMLEPYIDRFDSIWAEVLGADAPQKSSQIPRAVQGRSIVDGEGEKPKRKGAG